MFSYSNIGNCVQKSIEHGWLCNAFKYSLTVDTCAPCLKSC